MGSYEILSVTIAVVTLLVSSWTRMKRLEVRVHLALAPLWGVSTSSKKWAGKCTPAPLNG